MRVRAFVCVIDSGILSDRKEICVCMFCTRSGPACFRGCFCMGGLQMCMRVWVGVWIGGFIHSSSDVARPGVGAFACGYVPTRPGAVPLFGDIRFFN